MESPCESCKGCDYVYKVRTDSGVSFRCSLPRDDDFNIIYPLDYLPNCLNSLIEINNKYYPGRKK